ncbi:response regulator [Aliirhizobium terrae]|uniref:response regulator n=1 Tax=Terrirhizobium terrae TaxID=2926709 RepID=UPI00336A2742
MKHILLVDDGSNAIELTAAYLSRFGFRVTSARDSQQIKKVILAEVVDVVVVDLDMRQENGLDIVRILASLSDAPMIIISGNRVEEADKVVGLELGASDYLTKPFGNRELLAQNPLARAKEK